MAERIGNAQIRQLYVGTSTSTSVADGYGVITGRLGIGNTAPSATLDVTGVTLIKSATGVSDLYLGNYSSAKYIRFHTNNADTYFDMNCGNIIWRQGNGNRFTMNMTSGAFVANGDVTAFSDKKLKENIKTLDGSKVLKMRGVSFDRIDTGLSSSGVIAQELQEVAPELVSETDGTLGVAYGNVVGYLIEAIKDQQKQIDELKKLIG